MNGAQLFVKCLESEGVSQIWGYPGGAIMPVYDALLDSPIRHYLTRHEQGAGFAAQGYARTTGEVGVCMATSGPGATNLITAIADAFMDSVALVAITGQVPTNLIGTDGFQEADVLGLSLPVCKHSFLITSIDQIPQVVRQAFETAASGRPGPVLIDFPKDISLESTDLSPLSRRTFAQSPAEASAEDVDKAREMIAASRRPVIYAGGGVGKSNGVKEFRDFVEALGIPTVHTLHGLGGLPGDHVLFLGMLGMHGNQAANHAVQNCDLLITVGARFDDRATGKLAEFAPDASVIHLDIDPAELSKLRTANVGLTGDIKKTLPRLITPTPDLTAWRDRCLAWKEKFAWRYDAPGDNIFAPAFLKRLSERAGDDTFICCDVGQHQMWVAQHYRFKTPRQHLTSGGLGTMGFGLPAAIGVQCGHPSRNVINISGDGSIMMNIQELATIKRYELPVKVVLFDNSALGMVRQWQELFFDNRESEVDLSDNPDFAAVADAFGIPSITIRKRDEVEAAIDQLLNSDGPILVHVLIDRVANVWPLVPPGANNAEMIDRPFAPGRSTN
ncbi:MAG: acetolactate synthase 2 catalytic subunit [Planctomycetota bacterium]